MIVTYFGWFCLAMVCLAVACLSVGLLLYAYGKAMERFARAVMAETRHESGRSIHAAAYWFSSHPQTTMAIRVLGQRMMDGYGVDPDNWRAEWNRRCKTEGLSVSEDEQHVD